MKIPYMPTKWLKEAMIDCMTGVRSLPGILSRYGPGEINVRYDRITIQRNKSSTVVVFGKGDQDLMTLTHPNGMEVNDTLTLTNVNGDVQMRLEI